MSQGGLGRINKYQWFTGGAGTYTFNVPSDVSLVFVTATGAGQCGFAATGSAGGGGGSGEYCLRVPLHCTPGGTITIVLGAGTPGQTNCVAGTNPVQAGNTTITPSGGAVGITLQGAAGFPTGASGLNGFVGGGGGGATVSGGGNENSCGTVESIGFCGGSAGGNNITAGSEHGGGKCQGYPGGAATLGGATRNGGGGAASCFGPGGAGAVGPPPSNGGAPPAGSWGAGGGGATAGGTSGPGLDGAALIEWVSHH